MHSNFSGQNFVKGAGGCGILEEFEYLIAKVNKIHQIRIIKVKMRLRRDSNTGSPVY